MTENLNERAAAAMDAALEALRATLVLDALPERVRFYVRKLEEARQIDRDELVFLSLLATQPIVWAQDEGDLVFHAVWRAAPWHGLIAIVEEDPEESPWNCEVLADAAVVADFTWTRADDSGAEARLECERRMRLHAFTSLLAPTA